MKYLLLLLAFVSVYSLSLAQGVISGKVVAEENGLPLAGASVYINSSTVGVTTTESGAFRFPQVPNGFYDIVVSYIGYEKVVYRATIQSKDLQITFQLTKKPTELRNVVVLSKSAREKWLKILRENFIGITLAAERCSILNEDEILFEDGNSRDSIKAFTTVPLEIVNKELGYRIFFELESFFYNPRERRTYFYGYSRFEELSPKDKVPARYLRNRERCYRGSTQHFYHALIEGKTKEEGFSLLNIRTIQGSDSSELAKQSPVVVKSAGGNIEVTKRNAMHAAFPVEPETIISKDSTAMNTDIYLLHWKERLRVNYNKNPYGKTFLAKKIFLQGNQPQGVYSDIDILEAPVYMDANGFLYNPLALQMSGFWSYEKLGNMLPIDYRPRKDQKEAGE